MRPSHDAVVRVWGLKSSFGPGQLERPPEVQRVRPALTVTVKRNEKRRV